MKFTLSIPMGAPVSGDDAVGTLGMGAPPSLPVSVTTRSLESLFVEYADFVFRTCRCLGLDTAAAEDATQQVFMVAARKTSQIPEGKERAFLFSTTRNIVANARRAKARRREDYADVELVSQGPAPDLLLERARARALMDRALDEMDFDLRTAFVLFEIEGLSFTEIAELLAVPRGTVASRIRRAREELEARLGQVLGARNIAKEPR